MFTSVFAINVFVGRDVGTRIVYECIYIHTYIYTRMRLRSTNTCFELLLSTEQRAYKGQRRQKRVPVNKTSAIFGEGGERAAL